PAHGLRRDWRLPGAPRRDWRHRGRHAAGSRPAGSCVPDLPRGGLRPRDRLPRDSRPRAAVVSPPPTDRGAPDRLSYGAWSWASSAPGTIVDRLILFDIDGTLLSAAGAAGPAFRSALERVFGTSGPLDGYSFAGRTDPQIARELLTLGGVPPARVEAELDRVWELYLAGLREALETAMITVFPGVPPLLDALEAEPAAIMGLLTGNVREGARLKLEAAGL